MTLPLRSSLDSQQNWDTFKAWLLAEYDHIAQVPNAQNAKGAWATATAYNINDYVVSSGATYACMLSHTSGTFATDMAAGNWALFDNTALRSDLAASSGATLVNTPHGYVSDRLDRHVFAADHGISGANTAAQNSLALNDALEFCADKKIESIVFNENAAFNPLSIQSKRSQIKFDGPGTLSGLYRKQTAPSLYGQFIPVNEVHPEMHLKALSKTDTPTVVIMGDSISTDGPNQVSSSVSMWSNLKARISACNPGKTFTFYNRAIGGQTWAYANDIPYAFESWYTNHTITWLDYIKDLAPDVLFIAFGMNDGSIFNDESAISVLAKINTWIKVPDIILITNPVPALSTIYPDGSGTGFVTEEHQEGRDAVAGWVRTYAKYKGYGLIDINRAMVAARDGYDVQSGIMSLVETVEVNHYFALVLAKDFSFDTTCNGLDWGSNVVLQVSCGRGPLDVIFLIKTGGNFEVYGYSAASLGGYWGKTTNVAIPNGLFRLSISVYGDIARIFVDGALIAEFQTIRHGGRFYPAIGWQGSGMNAGPLTSVTYSTGYGDSKYGQTLTDEDIWGPSTIDSGTKFPFSGNGINHYSAKAIELVVKPTIDATNLQANRDVFAITEGFITVGIGTTKLSPEPKCLKIGKTVHLTGQLKHEVANPGSGVGIFAVPLGFIPASQNIRFGVYPSGPLFLHTGNGVFVCEIGPIDQLYSLDGISYLTA